ncbi:MAG: hypothetical protein EOM15_15705, partial [Spirochaetia bacterium]|nr:hypothetical protein [Spirochaetia bacterium]
QAELDAERLQKELAVLESEIAMRQTSISAELDARLIQSLQLEQQRAKALENSKELGLLRLKQIREQAAYQLSLQEKELAQKRALEETVVAKREELVQQAEIRRAQLAELDRKRSLTSDAFERLALIADMEKAILVIEASFTESIIAMKEEFAGLHQEQVASYRVADPQDPWETEKEFEARLVAYESALVALAETKILEIERQRRTEVENIKRQLEQAKHELQSMQFTLGPTATAVIVSSFDAQNKQFPITIVSTDSLLPLYASLFFKIDSTDRTVLQREYQRVDDADKAKALVGTIRYSLKEVSPSLWSIEVVEAGISSLFEGSKEHPTVLVRCNSQYEIVSNMLTLVDGKVISIPMTYVEGGSFQMGSVTGDDSDEQFVREVLVGSFYMGTYEVTQDIYQAVMGVNPSYHRNARLPVEQVNWYDAIVFANALSKKDGFEEVYT